jgi:thiol:disulfide interchange protein/DsbC/DsbD-like thiol-disulfide interchange protein
MRSQFSSLLSFLVGVFALVGTAHAQAMVDSAPVQTEHTEMRLLAPTVVAPGVPVPLVVEVKLQPEWHIYWENPGDSGIPTRVVPTLSEGWKADALQYTLPKRFEYEGLVSYGYGDTARFMLPLHAPNDFKAGDTASISVEVKMLICHDVCIPENATLQMALVGGSVEEAKKAKENEVFIDVLKSLPQPYTTQKGYFLTQGEEITFILEFLDTLPIPYDQVKSWDLLVRTSGVTGVEKAKLDGAGDALSLTLSKGTLDIPEQIDAVLVAETDDGPRGWLVSYVAKGAAAATNTTTEKAATENATTGNAGSSAADAAEQATAEGALSYAVVLLFALLGGLILNAMPCVFPVLSLKALALAKKAESEHHVIRAHGLAYSAGVLLCFVVLGVLMLVLQSAGKQIGWGFQLQSAGFVAAMTSLFFLLGLNLLGLFEFPLIGANLQSASRESSKGSFFTGLLAALVATPCTAPFMGSALGAAIGLPAVQAVGVFAALGVGMALPFLLLSLRPALAKCLPKPGVWMQRLKEVLAFPMLAAALWLLWVLAQQVGPVGFAWVLVMLLLIGVGIYGWRLVQFKPVRARWGFVLVVLLAWVLVLKSVVADPVVVNTHASGQIEHSLPNAENYSAARLAELQAEGRAVFIDATAAWCLTCKVNERGTLASDSVRALFEEHNIAVLVADWTNEDPEITALLKRFGRNGVPVYAFFPADGSAPRLLPQILTPANVREGVEG